MATHDPSDPFALVKPAAAPSRNPFEIPGAATLDAAPRWAPPAAPAGLVYAGFWRRLLGFCVDIVCLLPLTLLVNWWSGQSRLFYLYWLVPGQLLGWAFSVYLVQRYGGTPGKLLLKTRVAMVDGSPVTAKAANLRYAVLLILSALSSVAMIIGTLSMTDAEYLSLGFIARSQKIVSLAPSWYMSLNILLQVWIWGEFLTMLFNKKRRSLADFIAGTVVLRTSQDDGG